MSDSGLAESAAAAVNRNAAPAHVQNLQIEKTDIGNNKLTCASIRRRAGGPQPGFALFRTGRDGFSGSKGFASPWWSFWMCRCGRRRPQRQGLKKTCACCNFNVLKDKFENCRNSKKLISRKQFPKSSCYENSRY